MHKSSLDSLNILLKQYPIFKLDKKNSFSSGDDLYFIDTSLTDKSLEIKSPLDGGSWWICDKSDKWYMILNSSKKSGFLSCEKKLPMEFYSILFSYNIRVENEMDDGIAITRQWTISNIINNG